MQGSSLGVVALPTTAVRLWESGILTDPRKFSAEEIFDRLDDIMKGKEYDNN